MPSVSDALLQAFDPGMFWEYRVVLLRGLVFNFYVFAAAAAVALVIGLIVALLRLNRAWPFRLIGTLHVELFRNAPDYIMVVWVHFVLPLLLGLLLRRRIEFDPFVSAVIALGFVYSGYFAETFRAGIQSIPLGHTEAGRAVGLSELQILRRIILPQAMARMIPPTLNVLVILIKESAVTSAVSVTDPAESTTRTGSPGATKS